MKKGEREQIHLILQHESLAANGDCQSKLKALYADHAARGCLQSGATAEAGTRIMDEIAEQFIQTSVTKVSLIVMNDESFSMIELYSEALFEGFFGTGETLTFMTAGNRNRDYRQNSIADAIRDLITKAHSRAKRQLEIHRYSFANHGPAKQSADIEVSQVSPFGNKVPKTIGNAQVGRLPAEWWDDLWIEIFRQIHLGDLKPKSQADIVRAMQQWLSKKEIETGDSTLKPRARKLLYMLQNLDD